jgi:hypothetical protein
MNILTWFNFKELNAGAAGRTDAFKIIPSKDKVT